MADVVFVRDQFWVCPPRVMVVDTNVRRVDYSRPYHHHADWVHPTPSFQAVVEEPAHRDGVVAVVDSYAVVVVEEAFLP